MKVNERLKMLRLQRGMTQTELATALRIGQTTVAAYENGNHEPQIFSLLSYAEFFGCSVDYLLGRNTPDDASCDCCIDPEEYRLLSIYRDLTPAQKNYLIESATLLKKLS